MSVQVFESDQSQRPYGSHIEKQQTNLDEQRSANVGLETQRIGSDNTL